MWNKNLKLSKVLKNNISKNDLQIFGYLFKTKQLYNKIYLNKTEFITKYISGLILENKGMSLV